MSIITEIEGPIAHIILSNPKSLNALSIKMGQTVYDFLEKIESSEKIKIILIYSNTPKAFAAGVDISEMTSQTYPETFHSNFMNVWARLGECRRPIIAAIHGYTLGGGLELAMMADVIFCTPDAVLGQPEVSVGTIPGIGGTQRLIRRIGSPKAMDIILGSRKISGKEAYDWGLVSRLFPYDTLHSETISYAHQMTLMSLPLLMKAKSAVKMAEEVSLSAGLAYERTLFQHTFGLNDQMESMQAFLEKRPPKIEDR